MVFEKLDEQAIKKLREQMVDENIEIVATGHFEYKGKMRELVLKLKSEDCEEDGWICHECDKEMKNSEEGITYDDIAYCSQECIDERKAQE